MDMSVIRTVMTPQYAVEYQRWLCINQSLYCFWTQRVISPMIRVSARVSSFIIQKLFTSTSCFFCFFPLGRHTSGAPCFCCTVLSDLVNTFTHNLATMKYVVVSGGKQTRQAFNRLEQGTHIRFRCDQWNRKGYHRYDSTYSDFRQRFDAI